MHDAALDTTAALVQEHGLASVTMSKIAAETGIGRATLHAFISDLLTEGAKTGGVRDDVAPGELARYCLHALTAAGGLPSPAAVRRLLDVTLAGLRPLA